MTLNSENKSNHNTRCLALGVFDLFHIGHLNYLKFAKAQGSELFVAVAPDDLCFENKKTFPIISQHERMTIVSALAIVDHVALVPSPIIKTQSACRWIKAWGINKVVVGGQWQTTLWTFTNVSRSRILHPSIYTSSISLAAVYNGCTTADIDFIDPLFRAN